MISLCKQAPNPSLFLPQLSVIYQCKLLIIKTSKALFLALSYQRHGNKGVFLPILIIATESNKNLFIQL